LRIIIKSDQIKERTNCMNFKTNERPLIVYEMANNHQGSVEHGKKIIRELKKASNIDEFDYAVKFQYRDLDSFIHPDYSNRMDLKFVKRFSSTKLSDDQYLDLINECKLNGFKVICTPFDEKSVYKIIEHKYDYIKIASCSIKDWPLITSVSRAKVPVIASTGGGAFDDIDKLVSHFYHQDIELILMHCVGIYPTPNNKLKMNMINFLKERYRGLRVGYSTHENPEVLAPISIAVAKGASVFEKHVGLETSDIKLNKYSCNPEQVKSWVEEIYQAYEICGEVDKNSYDIDDDEVKSLADLKRGVFAKRKLNVGDNYGIEDVFFAMPVLKGQMTSEMFSTHNTSFVAKNEHEVNSAIFGDDFVVSDTTTIVVSDTIHKVKGLLNGASIIVNRNSNIELSHHYGVENIKETGAVLIDCINEEYCKKIIVMIAGQKHPEHYHIRKKESFQILAGSMFLTHDGVVGEYFPGDIVTINSGEKHSFCTHNGVIFEEISTTHYSGDSVYLDDEINGNNNRKTDLKELWIDF